MQLGGQRGSGNIQDRRGMGIGGGIGIGGVIIAIVAAFLGLDPSAVLNMANEVAPQTTQSQKAAPEGAPADEMGQFVSKVLGSTEDVWKQMFRASGKQYREPKLVLYTQAVRSACGTGQSAMGPFYCPNDEQLYIDLSFYRDLKTRFRAPGDFAQAYVIAHEVGHHVQNQLGVMQQMQSMQGRVSRPEYNQLSVRMELQADCFAGVWAYHTNQAKQIIEQGDVESALNAASAIGDDALQRQSRGEVVPDSFTHGTSAQRVRWFKRGLETGSVEQCNTFEARQL
jgi:predicted metalloprotease